MPEEPTYSLVFCTDPNNEACAWSSEELPTADIEARQTVLAAHLAEVHPTGEPDAGPAAIRSLHEGFLNGAIVTDMRTTTDPRDHIMAERSWGVVAAWSAHRLLLQLAAVDPTGARRFALELKEELELASYGDDMADTANSMGFPAQTWIDEEFARQDAETEEPTP
ncbi:hypothetical protein [Streptomyces sp. NPDC060366]|uniref:hypothetical protein n=1 Tax=Streptomyces sp. NPDC060366 TaxID=3347105 RepID=UPI0036672D6C